MDSRLSAKSLRKWAKNLRRGIKIVICLSRKTSWLILLRNLFISGVWAKHFRNLAGKISMVVNFPIYLYGRTFHFLLNFLTTYKFLTQFRTLSYNFGMGRKIFIDVVKILSTCRCDQYGTKKFLGQIVKTIDYRTLSKNFWKLGGKIMSLVAKFFSSTSPEEYVNELFVTTQVYLIEFQTISRTFLEVTKKLR